MSQQVVIKKGDEMLEDVTLVKPDTKVNLYSGVKYPTDDLCRRGTGGAIKTTFMDEDEQSFDSPHAARTPADPDAESASEDDSENVSDGE